MRFYENPEFIKENRLKQRAFYIPENPGAYTLLNGEWNFKYYSRDFMEEETITDWEKIPVPSCWQLYGYEDPNYTNVRYPYPVDFPYVPDENPLGVYMREFEVEDTARRHYVVFEGVSSNVSLYINDKYVGYSQGSRLQAEFDITEFVNKGTNKIVAKVHKWCTGSYLEDQDCFRMNGIFRDVYLLSRPEGHIKDIDIITENNKILINFEGSAKITLCDGDKKIAGKKYTQNAEFTVKKPVLWNAENPYLYKLVFEYKDEVITQKIGFVTYSINEEAAFCVNGVPVKLKGVNRHDTNPNRGWCMTEEELKFDLEQMKKLNINTIRTSHYPPPPKFLNMCDEMGFYVMLETDLEGHGITQRTPYIGKYDMIEEPDAWMGNHEEWIEAFVERMERAYNRDKNHTSIFSWSTGNESGYCEGNKRMIEFLRKTDKRRLIHCEDASHFTEHYPEFYWDPDLYSRMYINYPEMEAYAQDETKPLPFYLCEYAHAMGNGPGELADYWETIYKYPKLIGGCIWEWADHTVLVGGVPQYGGDFKELTHDAEFCVDGLVTYDRQFKAGSLNAKYVYQYARFELKNDKLAVTNLYDFTNLNKYRFKYETVVDGNVIDSKTLCLDLEPKQTIGLDYTKVNECELGAFVNCYLYDETGYEVAMGQLSLDAECSKIQKENTSVKIEEGKNDITIYAGETTYTLSKVMGEVTSIVKGGKEQLLDNVKLTVMRAPTSNERNVKIYWYKETKAWQAEGFEALFNKCYDVKIDENRIIVKNSIACVGRVPFFKYTVEYTFFGDGSVKVALNGEVREDCAWLPRLGFEFVTPYENERFTYFGRGDSENYVDMKNHTKIGYYHSDADKEYCEYVYPQEHGNHTETKVLDMENGLSFKSDAGFEFNVSHYTAMNIMQAKHIDKLKKEDATIIRIDYKDSGLGSNSCGPELSEKYRLMEKKIENFVFYIE